MSPDDIAIKHLKHNGRMLSGSKSTYAHANPRNEVFFNANVYIGGSTYGEAVKIWYGDLDLTKSKEQLQALAKELGQPIYVTREQPWRFNEVDVPSLESAAAEPEYPSVYKITP